MLTFSAVSSLQLRPQTCHTWLVQKACASSRVKFTAPPGIPTWCSHLVVRLSFTFLHLTPPVIDNSPPTPALTTLGWPNEPQWLQPLPIPLLEALLNALSESHMDESHTSLTASSGQLSVFKTSLFAACSKRRIEICARTRWTTSGRRPSPRIGCPWRRGGARTCSGVSSGRELNSDLQLSAPNLVEDAPNLAGGGANPALPGISSTNMGAAI